jgi:hypothetical protein
MTHRLAPICAAVVATACFSHAASAVTLYNPSLGTAPSAQGWFTSSNSAAATAGVSGGSYRLDTTADPAISAGSALLRTAPLDTSGGVDLGFTLQVSTESHLSADRSGYSVIAVGSNPANAIEIAFWGDRVWAYGTSFTHGVEALIDTSVVHAYSLTLQNQRFSLSADGVSLLTGSLVDYSAQGGIYAMGNSLFFGDDTSRAASSVALGSITLAPVPEPATAGLFLLGGALLAVRRRRPKG